MSGAQIVTEISRPKVIQRTIVSLYGAAFSSSSVSQIVNDVQEFHTALFELPHKIGQILLIDTYYLVEPVLVPIQTQMRPSNVKRNYHG
jgi:hypothetical protein